MIVFFWFYNKQQQHYRCYRKVATTFTFFFESICCVCMSLVCVYVGQEACFGQFLVPWFKLSAKRHTQKKGAILLRPKQVKVIEFHLHLLCSDSNQLIFAITIATIILSQPLALSDCDSHQWCYTLEKSFAYKNVVP